VKHNPIKSSEIYIAYDLFNGRLYYSHSPVVHLSGGAEAARQLWRRASDGSREQNAAANLRIRRRPVFEGSESRADSIMS